MLLLAFDTSSPAITVALHDGDRLLAEHAVVDARRHGELLAPGIARVLEHAGKTPSDLTDIAVGVGPGPFTGLRVGLMTARALADALPVQLHGVCSLDIVAAAIISDEPYLVASDARRREVYWATYASGRTRVDGPHVDKPADVAWRGPSYGAGAAMYNEVFGNVVNAELPNAAVLASMVASGTAMLLPADPLYLRRPDAVEPPARKVVTSA